MVRLAFVSQRLHASYSLSNYLHTRPDVAVRAFDGLVIYTGAAQPNDVAAELLKAAAIDSPDP